MDHFHLKEKILNKTILIGGCGRSGTSVLGNLIASHRGVEYLYDPAFLHKLMYEFKGWDPDRLKQVLTTWIFDDKLMDHLAGRGLNLNPHDLSSAENLMGKETLEKRLSKSWGRLELIQLAKDHRMAIKVTDFNFTFQTFQKVFPEIQGLFIYRPANEVINSLVKKSWWSDKSLELQSPEPLIAFNEKEYMRIPAFVSGDDELEWAQWSETERAAYYWIRANSELLKIKEDVMVVGYNQLVSEPHQLNKTLQTTLDLKEGSQTSRHLENIQLQRKKRENLVKTLPGDFQKKIEQIEKAFTRHFDQAIV